MKPQNIFHEKRMIFGFEKPENNSDQLPMSKEEIKKAVQSQTKEARAKDFSDISNELITKDEIYAKRDNESLMNVPTNEEEFKKWRDKEVYRGSKRRLIKKTITELSEEDFNRLQKAAIYAQELEQMGRFSDHYNQDGDKNNLADWFHSSRGNTLIRDVPEEFASGTYDSFTHKALLRQKTMGDDVFTGKGGGMHFLMAVEQIMNDEPHLGKSVKKRSERIQDEREDLNKRVEKAKEKLAEASSIEESVSILAKENMQLEEIFETINLIFGDNLTEQEVRDQVVYYFEKLKNQ